MAVKHRCGFCRRILRENGTCKNPSCPRYVPDEPEEVEEVVAENATTTTTEDEGGK